MIHIEKGKTLYTTLPIFYASSDSAYVFLSAEMLAER